MFILRERASRPQATFVGIGVSNVPAANEKNLGIRNNGIACNLLNISLSTVCRLISFILVLSVANNPRIPYPLWGQFTQIRTF